MGRYTAGRGRWYGGACCHTAPASAAILPPHPLLLLGVALGLGLLGGGQLLGAVHEEEAVEEEEGHK